VPLALIHFFNWLSHLIEALAVVFWRHRLVRCVGGCDDPDTVGLFMSRRRMLRSFQSSNIVRVSPKRLLRLLGTRDEENKLGNGSHYKRLIGLRIGSSDTTLS
jgi:hypothetical protein